MADIQVKAGDLWIILGQRYYLDQVMGSGFILLRSEQTSAPLQLETDAGLPVTPTLDWLKERFSSGAAKRLNPHTVSTNQNQSPTAAGDFNAINARDPYAIVRQVVLNWFDNQPSYSLSDAAVRKLVHQLWDAKPRQLGQYKIPAPSTVKGWLKSRGSVGSRSLQCMANRTGLATRTKILPRSIHKRIDRAARTYWSSRQVSLKMAYEQMKVRLMRLNQYLHHRNWGSVKIPCRETFRLRVRYLESHATVSARFGVKEANRRYKANGRGLEANRPLLLGALDHSVVDCHVVHYDTDWRLLGRPWITILIDVNTRCIVGWVTTFEPPSIYSVTECIKRANRPKPQAVTAFTNEPALADIFGMFSEIVVDNGMDLAGVSFESSMIDVGTSVRWAPIASPTYKAIVERVFLMLNELLFKKLPGGTVPIQQMRDWGIDTQKEAVLSIDQLEKLINKAISTYHLSVHRSLGETPLKAWNRGISEIGGIPVIGDDEQLDQMLGTEARRTLNRSGIQLFGLSYHDPAITGPLLEDLAALEPARGRPKGSATAKVKVKYNPVNIGCIHVWNPRRRIFVTLPCTDPEISGRSRWLHEKMQEWKRQELQTDEIRALQARAELDTDILAVTPQKELKRRGRSQLRLAQAPRIESPRPLLRAAIAEPRHDGMAPIINMQPLAPDRSDGHQKPIRPPRGRKPKKSQIPKSETSKCSSTLSQWTFSEDHKDWEDFK